MAQVSALAQICQNLTQEVEALKAKVAQTPDQSATFKHQLQSFSLEIKNLRSRLDQSPEPKVALPDRFSGGRDKFFVFQESCRLYFRLRPRTSGSEQQRVGIITSLLQGDPQSWAFSLPADSAALGSVEAFFAALGLVYGDPDRISMAESKLRRLRQGSRSAEEFCSEFRRWATDTQWNDPALRSQFCQGLSVRLQDALALYETPVSLEAAMSLAIRVDRRLRGRSEVSKTPAILPVPEVSGDWGSEEPMQLGQVSSSVGSATTRRAAGQCFYCGSKDHFIGSCPHRPQHKETGERRRPPGCAEERNPGVCISSISATQFVFSAEVVFGGKTLDIKVLVDSGAGANLVDAQFARQYGVSCDPLSKNIPVFAIDSVPLSQRQFTEMAHNIDLRVGANHYESFAGYVMKGLPTPIVLGLPWLMKHNPVIDWRSGEITQWSDSCLKDCLCAVISCVSSGLSRVQPGGRDTCVKKGCRDHQSHLSCKILGNLRPGVTLPKAHVPWSGSSEATRPRSRGGRGVSNFRSELISEISSAQGDAPAGPPGRMFVPTQLRRKVLKTIHKSTSSGHPGLKRTMVLISRQFWWPGLWRDVRQFIATCRICVRPKTPTTRLSGVREPFNNSHVTTVKCAWNADCERVKGPDLCLNKVIRHTPQYRSQGVRWGLEDRTKVSVSVFKTDSGFQEFVVRDRGGSRSSECLEGPEAPRRRGGTVTTM